MGKDEVEKIAAGDVQEFIFAHEDADEKKLLLQRSEILGLPSSLVAQQIAIRRKARIKLPLFHKTKGIVYPASLNWEQCSSEATGAFKAEVITREIDKGQLRVADLTGGFGIDSFFFSKRAALVDYIDPDINLLNIARHNHTLLGCSNIQYHPNKAEEFLNQCNTKYDLIYLDPSRRDLHSRKVFRLADCEPNIPNLLPKVLKFTEFVLIKTSPLLDIQQGLNELSFVKKVIVVSVGNECKELLFLVQNGFSGEPVIEAYNLNNLGKAKHFFSFTFDEEKNVVSDFSEPQNYLYEPNASILKAGAFKITGEKFALQKIQASTHFYTSTILKEDFPGRIFRIDQVEFDPKSLVERKANVITRNYPLTAEELKKKLKLSDGGEKYVIGFSSLKKKHVVLATRLVQSPGPNKSNKK
jgi:16S rRNA G966 N2-methylase RsmD